MPFDASSPAPDTITITVNVVAVRAALEELAVDLYVAEAMCGALLERMDEARQPEPDDRRHD